MKYLIHSGLFCFSLLLVGCATGGQPVEWDLAKGLDYEKGAKVEVVAADGVEIPEHELEFIKRDVNEKVAQVMKGSADKRDSYQLKVTITRYSEGSSFARFVLAGLGQIRLYGNVDVSQGDPPVTVRSGKFEKRYSVGGFVGMGATMRKSVSRRLGGAIAEALEKRVDERGVASE